LLLSETARVDHEPSRGSYLNLRRGRRRAVLGFVAFASLRFLAACNSDNGTGMNPNADMAVPSDDGGGGGGDGGGGTSGDLALPVTPPAGDFRLSVGVSGNGTGTVTSQPGNINCGPGPTPVCSADYPASSQVTLTATAGSGSTFSSWTGACAGQGATCTVSMSDNQTATAVFGTQFCTADGACWEAPLPFGYDLNGVFAVSASNVWAVGAGGAIVHYDGQNWSSVPSPTNQTLYDVWARSATDIWVAAGNGGLMLHSTDGATFKTMSTTFTTDQTKLVWGTADHLYVPTAYTNVLVFDGTTWTKQVAFARADTVPSAISGTANNDVWVVAADGYIAHFNGTWNNTRNSNNLQDTNLSGVWAHTATDAWGVNNAGYVLHNAAAYNAGAATFGFTFSGAPLDNGVGSVSSIWGTSATSIYVNGAKGGATFYHFNGTAWTGLPIQNTKDVSVLNRVHGTADTDVWSVGQRGVTAHYDGTTISAKRRYVFGTSSNNINASDINSVWASSANDVWFTTKGATVVHYNGASFTETSPAPIANKPGYHLTTIWGSSSSDVWAGGDNGSTSILLHYNGSTWTQATEDPIFASRNFSLTAVYAGSPTLAFAAGNTLDAVEKWDGTNWAVDKTLVGLTQPVRAMWGTGDSKVLAVEPLDPKPSNVWTYNGAAWTVDSRISAVVYALGGSGPGDIWAGSDKAVYHFDGTAWTMMALPTTPLLGAVQSVSSSGPKDAWAIDSAGEAFHYDGMSWKQINIGLSTDFSVEMHVYSASPKATFIAGRGILSYRK
jgi:hypothetical protein